MRSASVKRPPDGAHCPGKEAIRPQQRCLRHRSAFKNAAKCRQTFSHFHSFIFNISLIFPNSCLNFIGLMKILRNFSIFYANSKILLKFPEISKRKLSNFSENNYPIVRKIQKKTLELEIIRSNLESEKTQLGSPTAHGVPRGALSSLSQYWYVLAQFANRW